MGASELLNIVLGGGLVGTIVAIAQLRSTLRKAGAEAGKAEAEAEGVRLENAEHATRILMEHIVKPLKDELNETRKQIESLKRSILRLRKTIDEANGCRYRDGCPVLDGLQKQSELDGDQPGGGGPDGAEPPGRGKAGQRDPPPAGG